MTIYITPEEQLIAELKQAGKTEKQINDLVHLLNKEFEKDATLIFNDILQDSRPLEIDVRLKAHDPSKPADFLAAFLLSTSLCS